MEEEEKLNIIKSRNSTKRAGEDVKFCLLRQCTKELKK